MAIKLIGEGVDLWGGFSVGGFEGVGGGSVMGRLCLFWD